MKHILSGTFVMVLWVAAACGGPSDSTSTATDPASDDKGSETNDAGPPQRGDWLVLHLLSDPENLNPITSNDAAASSVLKWVFPSLLTLDNETLEQRPVIARELPEISEDKLTYTFRLRDDVTFSDGEKLDADDVVFTFKVIKNVAVRAAPLRNYLNSVQDVVAVDPHTVRIEIKEPYFRNTLVLGGIEPIPAHYYDPDGLIADISVKEIADTDALPAEKADRAKKFAEQFNQDFLRKPVGPGAFKLGAEGTDLVTGERIVLRRRDDFWAPNDPVHGDAWVSRIQFRIINDQEAALVALKSGDLDELGLTPLQNKRQDTNADSFKRHIDRKIHISPGYTYLGWNQSNPILKDRQVRRALGYFVDKESMIENLLFGLGVPVESSIFVERPEYNKDLPAHVFDPAKGKAMLAAAGWIDTDGDGTLDKEIDGERVKLEFELISNTGNEIRRSVGLAVIDEMKRAGIAASFRGVDWSVLLQKVKSFDYDAVILGWAMSVTPPDPYQLWHSSQAVEGGSNHIAFKHDEVDRILEKHRQEFDPAKRKEMMNRFQEILYEEQPYTFLFMGKAITAWDRRFSGVTWYPSGNTDLGEWWVPVDQQKYTQ